MGKKMKLPFLSKNSTTTSATTLSRSSSWPWPSCHQPRTLSFRTNNDDNTTTNTNNNMFKTINSACLDVNPIDVETTESSLFTNTSESATASFSTASDASRDDTLETVIRGLRSDRLFFEPGETSSILEEAKAAGGFPFKESLVLSMESQDPYLDFRKSMEEMVEAHKLKDWEDLEELLCWYLKMNGKSNHGYIVGAFVDLLVGLAFASSINSSSNFITCSSSTLASCSCSAPSPSSPLSFYTSSSSSEDSSSTPCISLLENEEIDCVTVSPCLSSLLEAEDEIEEQDDDA